MCGQSVLSASFLATRINLDHLENQTRNSFPLTGSHTSLPKLCPQSRGRLQLAGRLLLGLESSEEREIVHHSITHTFRG